MQRLFSTFARGWPGAGLLLQRLVTAGLLFFCAVTQVAINYPASTVLHAAVAGSGLLLLLGLWTPLAGMIAAICELAIAISHRADPWMSILLATLAGTLAMIGPGAWSIDARLFGRKQVRM